MDTPTTHPFADFGTHSQATEEAPNPADESIAETAPIAERIATTEQTADQGNLPRPDGETLSVREPPADGEVTIPQPDEARAVEFQKLDETVKSYAADSLKAGKALAEIMAKKLWNVNFKSWAEYRAHLAGFATVHVARLVYAATFVRLVESANQSRADQKLPLPKCEWQIRAIPRKLEDKDKLKVWEEAILKFGDEPSHSQITEVVAKLMPKPMKVKTESSKTDILEAFKEVEALVDAHAPDDDIKSALNRLSEILKLDKSKGGE